MAIIDETCCKNNTVVIYKEYLPRTIVIYDEIKDPCYALCNTPMSIWSWCASVGKWITLIILELTFNNNKLTKYALGVISLNGDHGGHEPTSGKWRRVIKYNILLECQMSLSLSLSTLLYYAPYVISQALWRSMRFSCKSYVHASLGKGILSILEKTIESFYNSWVKSWRWVSILLVLWEKNYIFTSSSNSGIQKYFFI